MAGVRDILKSSGGKLVAVIVVLLCVAGAGWSIWSNTGLDSATKEANTPLFIDAENGKTFHMELKVGMGIPVKSPFTGHMTGYRPELCYWTKDGHVKNDPTPVLMNQDIGKPGPTFCPDCGRLVVHHNPVAIEGSRPPPTKAEWDAMHH